MTNLCENCKYYDGDVILTPDEIYWKELKGCNHKEGFDNVFLTFGFISGQIENDYECPYKELR